MKTAYDIAKEELKDFTDFPTVAKIIRLMEMFGKQSYEAGNSVYVKKVEGANMLGVGDFKLSSHFRDYDDYLTQCANSESRSRTTQNE